MVVVHHADDQQFPHRLSEDDEEERRVFHVALTRAKERALVVATTTPTPFLAELLADPPAELLEATRPAAVREAPRRAATSSGSRGERDSPFRKGTVLAVPGQVLADQGQQWQIVSADAGEARATSALEPRRPRVPPRLVGGDGRRPGAARWRPRPAAIRRRPWRSSTISSVWCAGRSPRASPPTPSSATPRSRRSPSPSPGPSTPSPPSRASGLAELEDYGDALLAAVAAGVDAAG